VKDSAGNFATATAKVTVRKSPNSPAVDSGPHYTVNSACPWRDRTGHMDAVVTKRRGTASSPLGVWSIYFFKRSPGMRNVHEELSNFTMFFRVLILIAGICTLAALTPGSTATAPAFTISLVNNSGNEIRHLYLSPADNDNWGGDQLSEIAISPGSTRSLQVSWDQSTIKLVGEDQDGCFLTTTVDATGTQVWTITSNTARDCGN
jgi:hypothetical protein